MLGLLISTYRYLAIVVPIIVPKDTFNFEVVAVTPISDEIRRLKVITCDLCSVRKASHDVIANGVINGMTVLRRCCEECLATLNQPRP